MRTRFKNYVCLCFITSSPHRKNKKGKVVFLLAIRVCRWGRYIPLLILNIGTRWRWMVGFTPRLLSPPPRKDPRFPLSGMLGAPQNQSWHFGKVSLASAGIRTPNRPARSLVSAPTMISRLPQFWKVFQMQIARFNQIYTSCHTSTFCDWRCWRNSTWLARKVLGRWTCMLMNTVCIYIT